LVVNHRVIHIITSNTAVIASIYQVDLNFTSLPINQIPWPKCPLPQFYLPSPQIWKSNVEQYGQFIMGKNKMDAYQDNNQLKIEESNRAI
jgi:hypothetical protein